MRVTKDNVETMRAHLEDIEATASQITDAAETWLDDENDADERREARDELENQIPALIEQANELLSLIDPDYRARV